jgi:diguanylate cyclase (GGDEF)-like protein/PAS domain S-box-containing protein
MAVFATLPSSLKFRMTGVVVLLVLAATLIVTLVALLLAERDMRSVIGDQQFALLSSAAAQVDAQLAARQVLLASLADTLPLNAGEDPAVMQAYINRHHTARQEFLNLHIFTGHGTLLHTEGDHVAVTTALNPRSRAFLENALAAGKMAISRPYKSVLTGLPSIMMLQPVRDAEGHTVMLLGGSIDLTNSIFLEQIAAQKSGKTGFMYIMTRDGILLHHPDAGRLLEHINARPGYNHATEMALRGFEGWTEAVNKEGSEGIYAYKHLQLTDWIIGVRFPVDEAFAPMIQMRRHAMLAAAIFAVIAGLVAWLAIRSLLKPLDQLHHNVNDIRHGHAGIHILQHGRNDEIGELSSAFHELMAGRDAAQQAIRDSEALINNKRLAYEQQLAASEKRLRTIADSIPALIAYIDRDLRYRFTNEHFRTLLGHDPRDMLGKTVTGVLGAGFADSLTHYGRAALRGQRVHYEREGIHNGATLQMMGDLVPDIGADGKVAGFYMMALDITERKNAELQQAASEKRLKLLTDNLPVLIAYLDQERKFLFLNHTFQHWFGIDPQPLMGRHLAAGIGGEHYDMARPHLDQAYQGQMVTYEIQTRIGASLRTLETTFVPEVATDGQVLGIYSLTHDTTRMKEIEARLKQLARVDSLTGIANRLMFEEILQQAIVRARRSRKPMALAYLDIDHFKEINDTRGHGAGDLVLKEFASRLLASVRASDTVARLAGDEFVIVFEQVVNVEEAARLAAKIVEAMRPPFTLDATPRHVTTSIGVALHEGDEESGAELLARADSALYTAKRNGRDGYVIAA